MELMCIWGLNFWRHWPKLVTTGENSRSIKVSLLTPLNLALNVVLVSCSQCTVVGAWYDMNSGPSPFSAHNSRKGAKKCSVGFKSTLTGFTHSRSPVNRTKAKPTGEVFISCNLLSTKWRRKKRKMCRLKKGEGIRTKNKKETRPSINCDVLWT